MNRFPSLKTQRSPFRLLSLATLSALGLGLAPAGCGDQPELTGGDSAGSECSNDGDCADGSTCAPGGTCKPACESDADCPVQSSFCSSYDACERQCASCGLSCDVTEDCPEGQYCTKSGSCQQECEPDTEDEACGAMVCSADGECVPPEDIVIDLPTGGAGGMGGGSNEECIDLDVDFTPQIPNVVLLVDQSGSMSAGGGFGDAVDDAIDAGQYEAWDCGSRYDWRWNVVRNVLFNPDTGVVKPLEDDVRFGMALYSSNNGTMRGDTCPQLTEVELGFGTHEDMLSQFECDDIIEDTPTRESLTATAEQLAALDVDGPKVIVLATDGEPDNCYCPDWGDQGSSDSPDNPPDECYPNNEVTRDGRTLTPAQAEQYDVVIEAQRINEELGIVIEVINVSSPGSTALAAHLDDIAERGGSSTGASIPGFDPGALTDAFQSIIDGVRSCAIDLDGEISEGKEDTGTVTLDGEELILDDPDGWIVNSPTQIELVGAACDAIKSGDHELDISFPCDSFTPPEIR